MLARCLKEGNTLKTKKEFSSKSKDAKNDYSEENELRENSDRTKEIRDQEPNSERKREASKPLYLKRYD